MQLVCTELQLYQVFSCYGLAGVTVYSIAQDQDGFLWIATETGLSRFDGRTFKNYTVSDGLPDNDIIKLFVDSKNRVWVLPFLNKICFIEKGVVHNQENDSLLKKIKIKSVLYTIEEDTVGNIYLQEDNRIIVLERNEIFYIDHINGKSFNSLRLGTGAKKSIVVFIEFLFKNEQLFRISNLQGRKMSIYDTIDMQERTVDYSFDRNHIILSKSYNCFMLGEKCKIYNHFGKYSFFYKRPGKFHTISYLNDSLLSANCADTVFIMSAKENEIKAKFTIGKNVNTCFLDSEGNYWMGTISGGLYVVYSTDFKNYEIFNNTTLTVNAIEKFGNQIIAATHNGYLWNLPLSKYKLNNLLGLRRQFNAPIFDLISDGNALLISSGFIYRYKNNETIRFPYASFTALFKYKDTVLVGTSTVLSKHLLKNFYSIDTIWNGRVTAAGYYFDKYYIGTLEGLYTKDIHKNTTDYSKINKKLGSKIYGFAQDKNGILWVATYGKGIVGMNKDSVLYTIDESQGLSSNMCRQVVATHEYLWVATDKGINRISRSSSGYDIQVFGSRHGLVSDIINCIYVDSNTVYAGTPLGISVFKPEAISNNSICNISITEIKSAKGMFLFPDSAISLSAGDNSLLIAYNGVSFKSRETMKYFYRMSDVNKIWQMTTQTTIEYGKLSPGNYLFEIYAENAFGKRSAVQQIEIRIGSFFYQRWWFYALSGIIILSLLSYFIYRIILNERKKSTEKNYLRMQMGELEQMALKAQMNPHFIFNCLNSIQQFIFLKNPREVNYFITRFASLIRQTLEFSGQKYVTLASEIKYYDTYLQLEKFRFEEGLGYEISVSPEINKEEVTMPPLLLQPFVENSIKHGIRHLNDKTGKINLHFTIVNGNMVCEVIDNGIGRQASALIKSRQANEHQSRGMALAEKRIANINAFAKNKIVLEIADLQIGETDTGTKVTIIMPLIHD